MKLGKRTLKTTGSCGIVTQATTHCAMVIFPSHDDNGAEPQIKRTSQSKVCMPKNPKTKFPG
jgi:hypothetical protein